MPMSEPDLFTIEDLDLILDGFAELLRKERDKGVEDFDAVQEFVFQSLPRATLETALMGMGRALQRLTVLEEASHAST
jgi:hypothetical protein